LEALVLAVLVDGDGIVAVGAWIECVAVAVLGGAKRNGFNWIWEMGRNRVLTQL